MTIAIGAAVNYYPRQGDALGAGPIPGTVTELLDPVSLVIAVAGQVRMGVYLMPPNTEPPTQGGYAVAV